MFSAMMEGPNMRAVARLIKRLKSDESGSALIEYTVLLGILVVAVIAIIIAVGGWVNQQWANLNNQI
jgi:pilus assembly protein Flp/PilA